MVSHADIRSLIEREADPAVSIYMPVWPALPDRKKNAIRARKLLRAAEDRLRATGHDAEAVLAAARRALDPEPPVEGRGTWGLAVFAARGEVRVVPLPGRPGERVAVDAGFDVLPLLPFADDAGRFYVLTLDQAAPALYRGDRGKLEQVASGVMERSLAEIRGTTELPGDVGFHAAGPAGQGRPAAFRHAQGESPDDYQQTELDRFAHGVARAAERRLKAETAPLVPVGEPNLLGMFRRHCRYGGLTGRAVAKSPAGLDEAELHRLALEIAEAALAHPAREALARLGEAHNRGDGTVALDPDEVAEAAAAARVGTLLIACDPPGNGPDSEDATAQERRALHRRVVRAVMAHGGEVLAVAPDDLPVGTDMAALLRF